MVTTGGQPVSTVREPSPGYAFVSGRRQRRGPWMNTSQGRLPSKMWSSSSLAHAPG